MKQGHYVSERVPPQPTLLLKIPNTPGNPCLQPRKAPKEGRGGTPLRPGRYFLAALTGCSLRMERRLKALMPMAAMQMTLICSSE